MAADMEPSGNSSMPPLYYKLIWIARRKSPAELFQAFAAMRIRKARTAKAIVKIFCFARRLRGFFCAYTTHNRRRRGFAGGFAGNGRKFAKNCRYKSRIHTAAAAGTPFQAKEAFHCQRRRRFFFAETVMLKHGVPHRGSARCTIRETEVVA